MATEDINFKVLEEFATNLTNGKFAVEPSLDSDLNFVMMAYRDYTGAIQKVLAKDQAAYVKSLRITDFSGSNGLLHHDSFGDIEGGQVTIAELNSFVSDDTLISNTTYNAYTVLAADLDDTPFQLTLTPSTILGRESTGGIVALDAAAIKGIAQVSMQDTYNVNGSIALADNLGFSVSGGGFTIINASYEDKPEDDIVTLTLNSKVTRVYGNQVRFKDTYLSSDVTLSESGENALSTISNSIIGAINEVDGKITSFDTEEIEIPDISTASPAKTQLSDLLNQHIGRGIVSGGVVTANATNPLTEIDVAAGEVWLSDSATAGNPSGFMDVPAATGLSVTANVPNFIYAQWGASGATWAVTTNPTSISFVENIAINEVVFPNSSEIIITEVEQGWSKLSTSQDQRATEMARGRGNPFLEWADGATIGTTGARYVTMTPGIFWAGEWRRVASPEFNTDTGGDTLFSYYRDGASGHTKTTGLTQLDNVYYDDGTGTLAALSPNRYTNRWLYLDYSTANLGWVYDTAEYITITDAENATPPADVPAYISQFSVFVGRITVQQGVDTTTVVSAFGGGIATTPVTSHTQLSNTNTDPTRQHITVEQKAKLEYYSTTTSDNGSLSIYADDEETQALNGSGDNFTALFKDSETDNLWTEGQSKTLFNNSSEVAIVTDDNASFFEFLVPRATAKITCSAEGIGTTTFEYSDNANQLPPSVASRVFDDWNQHDATTNRLLSRYNYLGGSTIVAGGVTGSYGGIGYVSTGTSNAAGESFVETDKSYLPLGSGAIMLQSKVYAASSGANPNELFFWAGLTGAVEQSSGSAPTNALRIAFDSLSSSNWLAAAFAGGVETNNNIASVPVTTGWFTLTIIVSSDNTVVNFYVDNTRIATIASGLPTGNLKYFFGIEGAGTGTANKIGYEDYHLVHQNLNTKR